MGRARAWAVVVLVVGGPAAAQPPTPATQDLGNFTTVVTDFGQDGGFTDGAGAAGTNPGYTLFRYGTAGGSSGRLRITAPSDSPASLRYWTANPAAPNTSAAPAGFSASAAGAWTVITPKPGSTSPLQVTDADGSATYLPLTDSGQLGAYNARLNAVLKFQADQWYDPATGGVIAPSAGTFGYTFADFDAGLGYRSVRLTFTPTPVPEPAGPLAAAGLVLLVAGRASRRLP